MTNVVSFQTEKQARTQPAEVINVAFHVYSDTDVKMDTNIQDSPENRAKLGRLLKHFAGISGEQIVPTKQQDNRLVHFFNGLIFGVVASTVVALVIIFL